VVTRAQILTAGFSRRVIELRRSAGGLIPVHPGIYLVGHRAVSPLAHEAAAILACQPDAFLSDATAAPLWRIPVPSGAAIHVTVVGRSRRSLRGVEVRYIKKLAPSERRRHQGIPLTSPALTILDLAGSSTAQHLAEALNEARVLRLVSDLELERTLMRHPTRRGARALSRLLTTERGPKVTRSAAERRALAIMRTHGLVPDAADHPIGPYRVDFWFEDERLAVEVDGYRYHATPRRFVNDRRRTADLAARDIQLFPITWADLAAPDAAMERLRQTLARRRARKPE
jgi:very-short-patch-repair endonuclease